MGQALCLADYRTAIRVPPICYSGNRCLKGYAEVFGSQWYGLDVVCLWKFTCWEPGPWYANIKRLREL